jgi:hypothetical protein
MTHLKYLNETADDSGRLSSPLLPSDKQQIMPAEDGVPEPTTELAAYWQQRHENALQNSGMQALLADRLKSFQLSATHISDFVDLVHCGPKSFFLLTVLRFPRAPRPGLEYGNAIHETLEWIHLSGKQTGKPPGHFAAFKMFASRLSVKHLNSQDYQLFLDRGKEALSAYLKQRSTTISPDNITEHNFKNEGVFAGQAHLGGKIDKLIIDKKAKTITIVDYKTGRSHSRWTREIHLHKNRLQLYFYKALVEGSHTFAGYKVVDAYLEFVEPDEHGKIQELHLKFEDAEFQRIQRLAQAIWSRITKVELPETIDFSQDLAGIETFEEYLIT